MEYDSTLSKLQGAICSFENQGLLNKLEKLPKVIEEIKYITESLSDDAKSRVAFFLVLNTNLSILKELCNDEYVGLFTGITPEIEKEYTVMYLYHLKLQSCLFRIIENCPGSLGLELTEIIINKLKDPSFHKDEFGIEHMYQFLEALFVKISKIDKGLHLNDYSGKFVSCFSDLFDLIAKVLITTMTTSGLESYAGFHVFHFFKSFLFCLNLYNNPKLSDDPIYMLSIKLKSEEDNTVDNPVKVCISLIFKKIFKILEKLTLDLWMSFSECFFDFNLKNSIQSLIGNLVYCILEEIKDLDVPSDVFNCLKNLAINKFATAELDEIILNIRIGEKEWFEALIKHSAFTEQKCVKCIIDNIHLANSENLNEILRTSYEYICNSKDEDLDFMKDLFFTAIKQLSECSDWLEKVFEKYQPNLLTTACTQNELIETFNKISKESTVPICDLVILCMQSPYETIKRICQLAVYNWEQTGLVMKVLKLLEKACKMTPCDNMTLLDQVFFECLLREELTDKEMQSLINLIVETGNGELLGSKFNEHLLRDLKDHLDSEALEKALLRLKILKALLTAKVVFVNKAAILVFLAQSLGHFSWDLKSFTKLKADGRELVRFLVALIMKELETEEKDFGYDWARQEISKCWEVNQALFCDFWFMFGSNWPSSNKFHYCLLALAHSNHKAEDLRKYLLGFSSLFEIRTSIVLSLTVLLPVCTSHEWNSVFDNLVIVWERAFTKKTDVEVYHDVIGLFGSALYLLTLYLNQTEGIHPCYIHCLTNFGHLARNGCRKLSGNFLVAVFEKTLFFLTAIDDKELKKSCWMTLSPVLMEFIDCLKRNKDVCKKEISKLLSSIDSRDVAMAFVKRLA